MKYFVPFLVCLILVSCTHSSHHKKNDLELLHYNGRVKEVTYKIYKAITDSGKVMKGNVVSKIVTKCDSAGFFVEQSSYKGAEKLVYQVVRRYDKNNNLIMEERVQVVMQFLTPGNSKPDSLSVQRDTFALKFDDKGNITEKKVSENGKPYYRDENKLDDKGNIIECVEYIPWDTLNKKETYVYDKNDNMTEKNFISADGKLINKDTYTYDDNGNILTVTTFDGSGKQEYAEIMKYDDKGNKIADSRNKSDGTVVYNWKYEFSDFDEKGNWVKETTYVGGKPQSVIERKLEYYK